MHDLHRAHDARLSALSQDGFAARLQTNDKNLIPSNERREVAKWEQALEELKAKDFVVDRGHKGEVFEITNLGYQVADMISL